MSFTANSTGGEYKHKLTVTEIANHTHGFNTWVVHDEGWHDVLEGVAWTVNKFSTPLVNSNNLNTNSSGGSTAHNNIQPYTTVYFWRRKS